MNGGAHRANNSAASDGDSKGENDGQCGSKGHRCYPRTARKPNFDFLPDAYILVD
jgi:hypothetical protein